MLADTAFHIITVVFIVSTAGAAIGLARWLEHVFNRKEQP